MAEERVAAGDCGVKEGSRVLAQPPTAASARIDRRRLPAFTDASAAGRTTRKPDC